MRSKRVYPCAFLKNRIFAYINKLPLFYAAYVSVWGFPAPPTPHQTSLCDAGVNSADTKMKIFEFEEFQNYFRAIF
jgi:hypothetical protein